MKSAPYVPLRIFSCYTMLEGAIEPKAIAKQAKRLDFPAAALTDRNGLYAAMPFTDACLGEGVQPIVGTFLGLARPGTPDNKAPVIDWLALYAQDETGYANLCALVSEAHLGRPVEQDAHVALEALEGRTEGLIALTGGGEGALVRLLAEGQKAAAEELASRLQALFPDRLYIELSRRGDATEEAAEAALIDLAYARDLPLVATNPASYAEAHFHGAHDAMLCIAQSSQVARDDRARSSPEAWMKPADEMRRLFADLPEAIENTSVVARRCAVGAPRRKPILPSIAGDLEAEAEQLRHDARAGLEARLAVYDDLGEAQRRAYLERLDYEVEIIISMGFAAYFLIVADFIKWAKENDIPVGPGRGSGAGSVVAWSLTITDLDPIRLGLLFERFLNPERVSMPDFDIDFCETRRGEVIRYVQERYGADKVAQIITFGKLKARAVLKDTGRVLQMPYGQVDRLAKLVPNHPTDPWTLERALNGVTELAAEYRSDREVRRLFDLAMKLEGLPRHASTHAAGVVIGDRPLEQLVPLYRDPRSDMPVTQFDMKYVEAAGLVKFDFLGLKTLSVLRKGVELLAMSDPGVTRSVAMTTNSWTMLPALVTSKVSSVFTSGKRASRSRWRMTDSWRDASSALTISTFIAARASASLDRHVAALRRARIDLPRTVDAGVGVVDGGELTQADLPQQGQVNGEGERAEHRAGADVRGRLLAADMLLARRQGEDEAALAFRVLSHAGQPPRHLPHELLLAREQPAIRPAELQADAERLALADDDVGAHLARALEHPERDRLGHHRDQQRALGMRRFGDRRQIGDPPEDVRISPEAPTPIRLANQRRAFPFFTGLEEPPDHRTYSKGIQQARSNVV